jgi:hypothetical protein
LVIVRSLLPVFQLARPKSIVRYRPHSLGRFSSFAEFLVLRPSLDGRIDATVRFIVIEAGGGICRTPPPG